MTFNDVFFIIKLMYSNREKLVGRIEPKVKRIERNSTLNHSNLLSLFILKYNIMPSFIEGVSNGSGRAAWPRKIRP